MTRRKRSGDQPIVIATPDEAGCDDDIVICPQTKQECMPNESWSCEDMGCWLVHRGDDADY